MKCPVHNIEYHYTCPVCEEELRYFNGGVDAFRAGFDGESNRFFMSSDKAAYENGKRWRKLCGMEK
jgi:hypothetical protein